MLCILFNFERLCSVYCRNIWFGRISDEMIIMFDRSFAEEAMQIVLAFR